VYASAALADHGRLEGTIRSAEDGEPLPGANVVVLNTVLGDAADRSGFFVVEDIPPGAHRIKVSRIGYSTEIVDVVIREDEVTSVQVRLPETSIPISEVVISAGKAEQTLAETPGSVSVVGRDFLEEKAATSLEQVLPSVSGVDLRFGQVSIRGSTGFNRGAGSRVLLLVDGFPAITGDTGGINWDQVPLWEIDRVEIVKGASSALYGSNAFGGVINVITRAPSSRSWARVAVHAGWYGRPHFTEWRWTDELQTFGGFDGVYSRQLGRMRLLLSLGQRQSRGYRQNNHERRLRSAARIEIDHSPRLKSEIFASAGRMKYGYFQEWWSQGQALHVRPDGRGDRVVSDKLNLAAKVTWAQSKDVALVVRPSWYRTEWDDYFHDGDHFSNADRLGLETRLHWNPGARHLLISGVEEGASLLKSSLFGDQRAYRLGAYVQDEIRLSDAFRVTAGIRWDGHRVRGGREERQWSPKLAAVWRVGQDRSLRVSASRGFRAPSLAERYTESTVGGIRVLPNPDLRAESVWSGELGILQALGRRGTFSMAVFENRYEDLIQAGGDLSEIRFTNTHRARVRGVDVETTVRLPAGVSCRLGYCYQDHENRDTGEDLMYRPAHSLWSSLDLRRGALGVGADFQYQSQVDSVAAYPQDERVPLYMVNLRSSVSVRGMTVTFRVDNVLQYHFTPIERNVAPIRSYTIGMMGGL
jgi:iron complex outermembrane receptor protein